MVEVLTLAIFYSSRNVWIPRQEKKEESIQLAESSILLENTKFESVCSVKDELIIQSLNQKLHQNLKHKLCSS